MPATEEMVEKKPEETAKQRDKVAMVMFSGDLDKVLAALIIATTAASSGMDVTIFFTFWGLNVLKKNEGLARSKGLMRKMLNMMNRGGSKRLHLSKFHMAGMGTSMMKKLMQDTKMPTVDEMLELAKSLGVKMLACTTSIGVMGLDHESFREDLVDGYVGAATFLVEAAESKVELFI